MMNQKNLIGLAAATLAVVMARTTTERVASAECSNSCVAWSLPIAGQSRVFTGDSAGVLTKMPNPQPINGRPPVKTGAPVSTSTPNAGALCSTNPAVRTCAHWYGWTRATV